MKKTICELQYEVINKYKEIIDFRVSSQTVAYCYVPERIVYIHTHDFLYPTVNSFFDLLHEIGHILTNTSDMKRCQEEFYATEWAINEMKKYGYELSDERKNEFQQYIWKWRETGIKLKGKNMPNKNQLKLKW